MRLQSGIVYARHGRVSLKETGELQGAFALISHANRQGLQSPMEQETGVRVERRAKMVEFVRDSLDQIRVSDDDAGHDVVVAVQILSRAMDRQVEAKLRRPEVDRAGECVVD